MSTSKRKIHIMRAGHKVTMCGRWPSSKCTTVTLPQVQDWGDLRYCGHCTTASLRIADLDELKSTGGCHEA